MHERDRQTNRQTDSPQNGNIDTISEMAFSDVALEIPKPSPRFPNAVNSFPLKAFMTDLWQRFIDNLTSSRAKADWRIVGGPTIVLIV